MRRRDHVLASRARRTRRSPSPPGRSRRAGTRAARRRGSAPRPSPRSGGSGASRGRSRAGPPGRRLSPGLGSLLDGRHRAAIMLIRRCEPPISGRRSRRTLDPTGPRPGSRSRPRARSPMPLPSSARSNRAASVTQLRLHVTRSGGGVERRANIFRRLDGRRIWGTLALVGVIGDVAPAAADAGSCTGTAVSPSPGTSAVASSLRTGATSSASSSSTRATTCPARRSSARR